MTNGQQATCRFASLPSLQLRGSEGKKVQICSKGSNTAKKVPVVRLAFTLLGLVNVHLGVRGICSKREKERGGRREMGRERERNKSRKWDVTVRCIARNKLVAS